MQPDIVICSGDLTTFGFKQEYREAKSYLDKIECEALVVIPGNHDSRNVGYVHFEELFGDRNSVLRVGGHHRRRGRLDAAGPRRGPDRPRPLQLDRGAVRRRRPTCAIFVMHHHLLPIPGTGRERNIVFDAGDAIECLQRAGRRPRALGPQARAVRVAARGPVRRQRGHGLDDAPARQHAALLQRHRDHRDARGRVAQVPVPRAGADHPVLDRDAGVREVHRPIEDEVTTRGDACAPWP